MLAMSTDLATRTEYDVAGRGRILPRSCCRRQPEKIWLVMLLRSSYNRHGSPQPSRRTVVALPAFAVWRFAVALARTSRSKGDRTSSNAPISAFKLFQGQQPMSVLMRCFLALIAGKLLSSERHKAAGRFRPRRASSSNLLDLGLKLPRDELAAFDLSGWRNPSCRWSGLHQKSGGARPRVCGPAAARGRGETCLYSRESMTARSSSGEARHCSPPSSSLCRLRQGAPIGR